MEKLTVDNWLVVEPPTIICQSTMPNIGEKCLKPPTKQVCKNKGHMTSLDYQNKTTTHTHTHTRKRTNTTLWSYNDTYMCNIPTITTGLYIKEWRVYNPTTVTHVVTVFSAQPNGVQQRWDIVQYWISGRGINHQIFFRRGQYRSAATVQSWPGLNNRLNNHKVIRERLGIPWYPTSLK